MVHKPRKRFGQHFLADQSIIQRIVDVLAPRSDETLVEIGPGQGALTLPVLREARTLDAVEFDRDLLLGLRERCAHIGDLRLHEADALQFDFSSLKQEGRPLRVFGNLPYNISTPLIFHLLDYNGLIKDMLFMLQKEVVMRLVAQPRSADYGRLSVMTQYYCQADLLFDVPPESFFPPPQVNSSIVRLVPYSKLPYQANDMKLFRQLVKLAFGQRRKTLRNGLKTVVTDEMWEQLPVSPKSRAEELSVEAFVELANRIAELQKE